MLTLKEEKIQNGRQNDSFDPIDQLHVTSSPLAVPIKVLLEDQKRVVCIEFQSRLLLSLHFINILSLKVAICFGNRKN